MHARTRPTPQAGGSPPDPVGPRQHLNELLRLRVVRFVLVGASCFGLAVAAFALLRLVLPLPVAATLSYALGASTSYELNRSWTFGLRSRSREQIARFTVITAAAMLLNGSLVEAFAAQPWAPELAAEALSLACIAPLTFLAYRHWGFAQTEQG